jgi:hypothetical protein
MTSAVHGDPDAIAPGDDAVPDHIACPLTGEARRRALGGTCSSPCSHTEAAATRSRCQIREGVRFARLRESQARGRW